MCTHTQRETGEKKREKELLRERDRETEIERFGCNYILYYVNRCIFEYMFFKVKMTIFSWGDLPRLKTFICHLFSIVIFKSGCSTVKVSFMHVFLFVGTCI